MHKRWWTRQASNLRQSGYEPGALPTELRVQQTEYASIPAVWQEKKDVPPGISRTEKLRNIPAPCLPNLPPLRPQSVLPEMGRRAPHSEKNTLSTGSPHSALPAPATAHSLKDALQPQGTVPAPLLPAGPKRLQRTGRPATDRSAFHKRPGTRTASDQPRLFSCRTPCSCAVPDQTHLVLRNTRKKQYSGQPPVCLQVPPSGLFLTALPPRQSTAKRPSLPKERGPCSPHGR